VSSLDTYSSLSRGCHLCFDEIGRRMPISCRPAKCGCLLGASSFLRQSCIEPSWVVHPVRTVITWTMIGDISVVEMSMCCMTFLSQSLYMLQERTNQRAFTPFACDASPRDWWVVKKPGVQDHNAKNASAGAKQSIVSGNTYEKVCWPNPTCFFARI